MTPLAGYVFFLVFAIFLGVFFFERWFRTYVVPKLKPKTEVPALSNPTPPMLPELGSGEIPKSIKITLAVGAFLVYLSIRQIGLDSFPIYFFSDEAAQTVLAEELVKNDFQIEDEYLPTYFFNVSFYNLSLSVYLQVLPYLLFGKSIGVTRGISVLVTSLSAISVGLILRDIFRVRHWWLGMLILSVTPAWLLHSRTAFETTLAVAFYALFLYAYLKYLYHAPKFLYLAVLSGALMFYAYNPARLVILLTAGLLLLFDWRFHRQNKVVVTRGFLLALLLTLPYLRFLFYHPFDNWTHLAFLKSYWVQEISFGQKLLLFVQEYLRGWNILYWYFPHTADVPRHIMRGYGHLFWGFLPFMLIGLWLALKNRRNPAYRVLLIALLSIPVGGALIENTVTRALGIVIPVALLTTLGLLKFLSIFVRFRWRKTSLAISVFAIFGLANFGLLADALLNGPTWFDDYGLYGMQYGGAQVFTTVDDFLQQSPDMAAFVSPYWLNGPAMVMHFFVAQPKRVYWAAWDEIQPYDWPDTDEILFVMTAGEYRHVTDLVGQVQLVISNPDETPAFYFVLAGEPEN